MTQDPCSVCGGKDLNLIDGYYYCVECGTQDTNAQETVVEHTMLGDGTFAHATTKKITKVLKDGIEMSGEWHKWHAFNFILIGLVEELMNLGAPSGFQDRVLWIWTKYIKEFMDKEQMGTIDEIKGRKERVNYKSLFQFEDDKEESSNGQEDEEEELSEDERKKKERMRIKKKLEEDRNSIKLVTKGLLLSIVYVALNLEKSDIQLSHIFWFIRERRLSISNCQKFVPAELDLKSIPYWKNFMSCYKEYSPSSIRQTAMSLIKVLDLGKPIMPDLRKMVNNYVKELCLPSDFKNLVFSLLQKAPCDYLDMDYKFAKKRYRCAATSLVRIPDFEGVVMSYVLVALKMTFGLDCQYEIRVSDAVDKINDQDNRLKSYKLGMYSELSDRLFSFREWSNYLLFRKTMLCKYYLPMAQQNNLDVDDHVFIEQLGERQKRKVGLSDEVTMDILNKILPTDEGSVIPKSEFVATLTPMANYTEVILHYIQDPDVKLLISEDFTQYSLKYACENLKLLNGEDNLIKGVNEDNKPINKLIVGNLISKESDLSMVFVRNCENHNWLKTKAPTAEHITKIEDNVTENDSDHGYDSNLENNFVEINVSKTIVQDKEDYKPREIETIKEEKEGVSIFDDQFDDIVEEKEEDKVLETLSNSFQFDNVNLNNSELENDLERSIHDECIMKEAIFDPETFDRERTIKELILAACKKYKVPIPKEYDPREPIKRKSTYIVDETGVPVPKKRKNENKAKKGDAKKEEDKIISAYYESVEKDIFEKVSEHMKAAVRDFIDLEIDDDGNGQNDVNVCDSLINEENKDKTIEENHNIDKTQDSSVMEIEAESETSHDLRPKVNPNFDEKTHDVRQLYVKYSQRLHFENLLDNEDENIDNILEKKIEECRLNEPISLCAKDLNQQHESVSYEDGDDDNDDDDRVNNEEKKFLEAKLLQKKENLNPLIQNCNQITEFKYWLRHYTSVCMRKNFELKEKFDMELREHFPKSFCFILKECAAIIDCSAFSLYKHMQNLEQILFK